MINLCVMEHQQSNKLLTNGQAIPDSLNRSIRIFNDGFLRQYLYSVFIAGTSLRLFQLDRGGIVYFAADLNIEEHPEVFLKFVAWLSVSSPDQLGYGSPPDKIGKVPIECTWNDPSKRPNPELLDSRGTTVWKATKRTPVSTELDEGFAQLTLNDGIDVILKMQWAHEARETTEADFLHAISDMSGVTKHFGNPSSEIKRMFLKLKAADTISISESSYTTSQQDIVSINPNDDNSLDDISPDDDSTDEQVFRQQRWIL